MLSRSTVELVFHTLYGFYANSFVAQGRFFSTLLFHPSLAISHLFLPYQLSFHLFPTPPSFAVSLPTSGQCVGFCQAQFGPPAYTPLTAEALLSLKFRGNRLSVPFSISFLPLATKLANAGSSLFSRHEQGWWMLLFGSRGKKKNRQG